MEGPPLKSIGSTKLLRRQANIVGTIVALLLGLLSLHAIGAQASETTDHRAQIFRSTNSPSVSQYVVLYKDGAKGMARDLPFSADRPVTGLGNRLTGFITELSNDEITDLQRDPNVEYIIEDFSIDVPTVRPDPGLPPPATPWSLDRIDQRDLPLDGSFDPEGAGAGVDIYIIDSGIQADHEQFGGRVVGGASFVASAPDPFNDCLGHGTKVASAAGGRTLGVAPQANLYALKVGACESEFYFSSIASSTAWILDNQSGPSVVNMSFSGLAADHGDAHQILVNELSSAGVTVVAAAGNHNEDACRHTPADSNEAITVGATSSKGDSKASFSNFGSCVDLFAPGQFIFVADPDGTIRTAEGTSLAAPIVAGAVALYLEGDPTASPQTVRTYLDNQTTRDVIAGFNALPNKFLFVKPSSIAVDCENQKATELTASYAVLCLELPTDDLPLLDDPDSPDGDDADSDLDWGEILDDILEPIEVCYGPIKPGPESTLAKVAFETSPRWGGCGIQWNDQIGHQCRWVDQPQGWQCFGEVSRIEAPEIDIEVPDQAQLSAPYVDDQPVAPDRQGLAQVDVDPNETAAPTTCHSHVVEGTSLEQAQDFFSLPIEQGGCGTPWNDQEFGHQCEWVPGDRQGWRCFGVIP